MTKVWSSMFHMLVDELQIQKLFFVKRQLSKSLMCQICVLGWPSGVAHIWHWWCVLTDSGAKAGILTTLLLGHVCFSGMQIWSRPDLLTGFLLRAAVLTLMHQCAFTIGRHMHVHRCNTHTHTQSHTTTYLTGWQIFYHPVQWKSFMTLYSSWKIELLQGSLG